MDKGGDGFSMESFHGFAGAFAVAAKTTGFNLKRVIEPGGFGVEAIENNRAGLAFDGPIITTSQPRAETHSSVDILVGNPPCSGFSNLNTSKGVRNRGSKSPINTCMWAFVNYAAELNNGNGPHIAIFESVQGAGKHGTGLMRKLRDRLEGRTNLQYDLYHVFMSGASVGSAQVRPRYFWVASRVPFGILPPNPRRVITYHDALEDLSDLPLLSGPQPYGLEPTAWSAKLRNPAGTVTDHVTLENDWSKRVHAITEGWLPGETDRHRLWRWLYEDGRSLPPEWDDDKIHRGLFGAHFSHMLRVCPWEAGRVITGSGGAPYVHYEADRTLTVRETARMMGFPDWFEWGFVKPVKAFGFLGKQVPVQSWEWIMGWAKLALMGCPGEWTGDPVEGMHRERVIDVTHDYKAVYDPRRFQHGRDARSFHWKEKMAARKF